MPIRHLNRDQLAAVSKAVRIAQIPQAVLAERLGVSRAYLTRLLSGHTPMKPVYALAIKMVLVEERVRG